MGVNDSGCWRACGVGAASALMILLFAAGAAAAATTTTKFLSPGAYEFTVPAGVDRVTIVAVGARGGQCFQGAGGLGAAVTATMTLRPGTPLLVGVGGPGADCDMTLVNTIGRGGTGGGGDGGATDIVSAGGGGAAIVGERSPYPAPEGWLVVAGGGGGAATDRGNDAGTGASTGRGGGPATTAGGGRGGFGALSEDTPYIDRACNCPWDGRIGSLGRGGAGGSSTFDSQPPCQTSGPGGGGGGGGYYGGGGGGACNDSQGGGGGGGSSFVDRTGFTELAALPTSAAPGVSLTYAAPTAQQNVAAMRFGAESVSTVQTLTVRNRGDAPLTVAGVTLEGADPDAFRIDNRCDEPVDPGASCEIAVRLAPQRQGRRSATLRLLSDAASAPRAVKLSGGRGERPPRSRRRAATRSALVTCAVRIADDAAYRAGASVCSARRIAGEIELTRERGTARAKLVRGSRTFAVGVRRANADGSSLLALRERRPLKRGAYTLVLRERRGRERVAVRLDVTTGRRLSGLEF